MTILLSTGKQHETSIPDTWRELTGGSTFRYDHASAVVNKKLYSFGGHITSSTLHDDLWAYDPYTNMWEQKSSGTTAR